MSGRPTIPVVAVLLALVSFCGAAGSREDGDAMARPTLLVLYDNHARMNGLSYGWGFAALVRAHGQTVLFDTGPNGPALLANLAALEVAPAELDRVFLSHPHWDHVDGLADLLAERPGLDVHVTVGFPDELKRNVVEWGGRLVEHGPPDAGGGGALEIAPGLRSTGELAGPPVEQGLVVRLEQGVALVTGCSHPGIGELVDEVADRFGAVATVVGGFHLFRASSRRVRSAIETFKRRGVRTVAPVHCTGAAARKLFRRELGAGFVDAGAGTLIEL